MLHGRVFVLIDGGRSLDGAELARALAEQGASVLTVHGDDTPPANRGVYIGDGSDPIDVDTATQMATELFGPVDAVLRLADLPESAVDVLEWLRRQYIE